MFKKIAALFKKEEIVPETTTIPIIPGRKMIDHDDIINRLNCPCTYYPAGTPLEVVKKAFFDTLQESREKGGFTPVLVRADDSLLDLYEMAQSMPADDLESCQDGKVWLQDRLKEARESLEMYEGPEWWQELVGTVEGGEVTPMFSSIMDGTGSQAVILARVPVDKPWEIFSKIPFGGWNVCPAPEEHEIVSKYWYEKYGAQPLVISFDTMEYFVETPVGEEQALDLAMEQYAYCADIVEQGVGTIGALAASIKNQNSWYFWWD